MKFLNILIPVTLIVIGVGCRSDEARTVSRTSTVTQQQITQTTTPEPAAPPAAAEPKPMSQRQIVTDKATYTIEVLPPSPGPGLTPTSREGDKAEHVYSSDIIAVHVHTNSDVPAPQKQPEP